MIDKQRKIYVFVACAVILLFVAAFLIKAAAGNRQSIVLPPEETGTGDENTGTGSELNSSVSLVLVSPETVQDVIATLARPESYAAHLTVTTYWSGGSGSIETAVYAGNGCLRADTVEIGGALRHMLTNGRETAVWYDEESEYYLGAASLSADDEMHLPSYEDVLQLAPEAIVEASYTTYEETSCIFVRTEEEGYERRYYVSGESGLLVGAETYSNGRQVYSALLSAYSSTEQEETYFLLPDGKTLS